MRGERRPCKPQEEATEKTQKRKEKKEKIEKRQLGPRGGGVGEWGAGKVKRPHLGIGEPVGTVSLRGRQCLAPAPSCLSFLGVWRSPGASVASAELLALVRGGRAGRRGGASRPGGSRSPGRGRGSSPAGRRAGGRAPESGGLRFPLSGCGGAWPLLPLSPPPPRSPLLSKINRAVACRSSGNQRSGPEEPRARPRLSGPEPVSAPRTAQRRSPAPRRPPAHQPTGAPARGVRISTADSAPGARSPPPAHLHPESVPRTSRLDGPRSRLGAVSAPGTWPPR